MGKLCNQACHHCHVDAGPTRPEILTAATARRLLDLLETDSMVETIDITGGAPEMCPSFADLVHGARSLRRRVTVRCNLTVIFEQGMSHLPGFYRDNGVELVCSLPCYTPENVDGQRGRGVFDKSIDALRVLNGVGYGKAGSGLSLDLVYNPRGAFLPPSQAELQLRYKQELASRFGVEFGKLLTITNMPIARFADSLLRNGEYQGYMGLLVNHFNPATVAGLMCRSMISVGWDGALYDCDFNQMLDIEAGGGLHLNSIEGFSELAGATIATNSHCFGCTAGAGSSCGGVLDA